MFVCDNLSFFPGLRMLPLILKSFNFCKQKFCCVRVGLRSLNLSFHGEFVTLRLKFCVYLIALAVENFLELTLSNKPFFDGEFVVFVGLKYLLR